uniref:Chromosome transmission fidelity protein 8 homolog n=1 Tax=Cacopsylla melanoneura TaxID=428564 RepID=A0A8D8S638_9HEMI
MQIPIKFHNEEGSPEWGLIELQGDLESRNGSRMENKFVGDLHFQKNGTPILIIGHHILHGKVQKLETPLAVMKKIDSNSDITDTDLNGIDFLDQNDSKDTKNVEYEILVVITRKMIFKTRPKPIVVAHDSKV